MEPWNWLLEYGSRIGVITLLLAYVVGMHKRYIVQGWLYDQRSAENEKTLALAERNARSAEQIASALGRLLEEYPREARRGEGP